MPWTGVREACEFGSWHSRSRQSWRDVMTPCAYDSRHSCFLLYCFLIYWLQQQVNWGIRGRLHEILAARVTDVSVSCKTNMWV